MYAVMQMGLVGPERYETREAAQDAADELNAELAEECGQDYGDGAATVVSEDEIPDA